LEQDHLNYLNALITAIRRILRLSLAHTAMSAALFVVCAIAVSPAEADSDSVGDLPTVISGGTDHAIKRWDSSGKLIDTLGTVDDSVNVIRLLPNGSIVSGGADGLVKTWSLTDARETQSFVVSKSAVTAIAVAPVGPFIAVGSADGQITLWNTDTGKRLAEMQAHGSAVQALQFAADGALLISGSGDKTIRMWKVLRAANKREMDRLEYQSNIAAHDDAVTAIALGPGDNLIATVSEDGWLKTWRLDGGLVGRARVCDHGVASVAFSPDGRIIATGDNDGRVRLWNAQTSAPMAIVFVHDKDKPVYSLAWTPNGKVLVSGGADSTIRYWNVETGQKIKSIAAHEGAVKALLLVP
jgi:WD40 repeat protein